MPCTLPTTKMKSWWFKSLAVMGVAVLVGCATPLPTAVPPPAIPGPVQAMRGEVRPVQSPVPDTPPALPQPPAQAVTPVASATSAAEPEQTRVSPAAVSWKQRGRASWYGKKFHGRRTASGERFSAHGFTAAHRTLPIPSYVRVRRVANGQEVIVRINDRGPFHGGRVLDLSFAAAQKLGMVAVGSAEVEIERLTDEDWRFESARQAATSVETPSIP